MVKLIVGVKGTGKTKTLIEMVNQAQNETKGCYVTGQDAFRGLNNMTIIDSNEFAQLLSKRLPAGIILAHNHPSGKVKPSSRDEEMTKRVQLVPIPLK